MPENSLLHPVKIVGSHFPTGKLVDAGHDWPLGNSPAVLIMRNRNNRDADANGNVRLGQTVFLAMLEQQHSAATINVSLGIATR